VAALSGFMLQVFSPFSTHSAFQRLPVGASQHSFPVWLILNSGTHQGVPGWGELRPLDDREIKACYYQLIAQGWEEYVKCL